MSIIQAAVGPAGAFPGTPAEFILAAVGRDAPGPGTPANDPFFNDGCTGFPNGSWRQCCDLHDPAFLNGQTLSDFLNANRDLFNCVLNSDTSNPWIWLVATIMFLGVMSPVGWWFFKRGKKS